MGNIINRNIYSNLHNNFRWEIVLNVLKRILNKKYLLQTYNLYKKIKILLTKHIKSKKSKFRYKNNKTKLKWNKTKNIKMKHLKMINKLLKMYKNIRNQVKKHLFQMIIRK